jgi:acid phosphatase family membrane protein YuiD
MYQLLILPILAGIIAQVAKMFVRNNHIRFSPKNLVAYSGMPSGHSATVISLTTIVGLVEGLDSPIFALSFVFAVLVIRDAVGLRRYLGEHGRILNTLVKDLDDDKVLEKHYPHLLERIGHTPLQVAVGGVIGFLVSLIGFLLLN